MSLSELRLQGRKFLGARYLADLEESPMAAPERVASINALPGNLEGEADWDLDGLTGRPYLGSRASISGDHGLLREASSWL